jgi:hypothetical protein
MTNIEARASGGLADPREGRSVWSSLLVPVLTAALVLALGLVLVGLTGDQAESSPGKSSTATAPLR